MQKIKINTPHITLGQLLKLTNEFESGGMIKHYLKDVGVNVNDQQEHRRGRKLYANDVITLENNKKYLIKQKKNV